MQPKGEVKSSNKALLFWLNTLAKMIVRNVTVKFSNFSTAYTNGSEVNIGVDGRVVQSEQTQKGKFLMCLGFLLHEIGHILYTPFSTRGDKVSYETVSKQLMADGTFPYEVKPSISYDAKFFHAHRMALAKLYSAFSNKVCDGHIEQRILAEFPHWRKEFMYMRNKWYLEAQTYEELKAHNTDRNTVLSILTLNYSLNNDAKIATEDDLTRDFDTLVPLLDEALKENDKTRRVKLVNDAFVKMVSIMSWTKPNEQNNGGNKSQQSSDGAQSDSDSDSSQSGDSGENGDSQENENSNSNSQNSDTESESNDASGDGENGEESEDEADGKGDADSSDDSSNESGSSEGSDSEDGESGSENGSSDSAENEPTGSDGSSEGNSNDGTSDNSSSSDGENGSDSDSNTGNGGRNNANAEQIPMTDEEVEQALSDMLESINQQLNELNSEFDPSNINNVTVDTSLRRESDDKLNDSDVNPDSLMEHSTEDGYHFGEGRYGYSRDMQAERDAEQLSTKLTSDIRRKIRNEKESYQKGLYLGKRLDTKRLYRADKRIMERKKYPDRPNMRVISLMDVSGSIGNDLLNREKTISLSIKKTCERLNQGCECYAFNKDIIPLLSDEKISTIYNISTDCTYDAHAFSYILTRMKKAKEKIKIVVITTDGVGDGHEKLAPMLKECKSLNIRVIACGLGSDRAKIERSWSGFGAKVLNCDETDMAKELCKAIVDAYK